MKYRWVVPMLLAALVPLAGCGAVYAAPGIPGASHSASQPAGGGGAPIPAPQRVTLTNSHQTITMQVGQTFTLALGDQNWNVQVADPSVLSRLPNVMMVRGAQGIYKAHQPGATTLTATGTAACGKGQACPMYAILFKVTVQVAAK